MVRPVKCKLPGYATVRLCACSQRLALEKNCTKFELLRGPYRCTDHPPAGDQPPGPAPPSRRNIRHVPCTYYYLMVLGTARASKPRGRADLQGGRELVAGVPRIGGIGRECGDELPAVSGLSLSYQVRSVCVARTAQEPQCQCRQRDLRRSFTLSARLAGPGLGLTFPASCNVMGRQTTMRRTTGDP